MRVCPGLLGRPEASVMLTHHVSSSTIAPGGLTVFQLNLLPPQGVDDVETRRAVTLARDADAAVVVVGTTEEVESEGFGRTSLALPGRQDEVFRCLAAVDARTIVVVNSGSPVLMPWADEVAAILLTWFPGQEFGNALADVLVGHGEPGGRLPTTWPDSERGLPSTQPSKDGALHYDEGLHLGYRRPSGVAAPVPARARLHHLGVPSADTPSAAPTDSDVDLAVRIRNSGQRRGREVVQAYLSRTRSAVARPIRCLAGFAVVDADPGEEVTVVITLNRRGLSAVAPHRLEVRGRHLPRRGRAELSPPAAAPPSRSHRVPAQT